MHACRLYRLQAAAGNSKHYSMASMAVTVILLACLLVTVPAVNGSEEDICISRNANISPIDPVQARRFMSCSSFGKDIKAKVRVEHSGGSCEFRMNGFDVDYRWNLAKLNVRDAFVVFVNGVPISPGRGCAESPAIHTFKTVSEDTFVRLLPNCSQGPAMYQISEDFENELVPWHGNEVRLVQEGPRRGWYGTNAYGQLVLCSRGQYAVKLWDASHCIGGAGTADITLIILKSNIVLKAIYEYGKEGKTPINNGAAEFLPTVKNASFLPTVKNASFLQTVKNASILPTVKNVSILPIVKNASILPTEKNVSILPTVKNASIPPTVKNASFLPTVKNASNIPTLKNASILPTMKNPSINDTVIMRQCTHECRSVKGCISRTALRKTTFQDEMDVWVSRSGKDVIVTVDHSQGSCQFHINDSELDNEWLLAKLKLKDTIALFVNGMPIAPRSGCAESLAINTPKTVSVDNAVHLLPDCSQGPAIYQVSKDLKDVLIPWYGEEAQLLLEPQDDTQIGIQVGGQEFVLCSNGTHTAAQQDAGPCTAGVGTPNITLIIPKSNTFIKVITSDRKQTETPITNGAAGVPPAVKHASVDGTVVMRQCMPQCSSVKDRPGYLVAIAIFLLLSVGLAGAAAYLVFRERKSGNACLRSSESHCDEHSPEKTAMYRDDPGAADETSLQVGE